jgi:hypothetical protein
MLQQQVMNGGIDWLGGQVHTGPGRSGADGGDCDPWADCPDEGGDVGGLRMPGGWFP